MHLNDAIGRCRDLSYVCCHHEQAARDGGAGLLPPHQPAGGGQRHHRARRHERDHRRLRRVDRLARHGRRLRPGEVGDAGPQHRPAAPPARRPGGGHRPPGRADHEVRGDGHRPADDPLSPRAGHPPRAHRAAGPGVARHSDQRAGGDDRSRRARGLHASRRGAAGTADVPPAAREIVARLRAGASAR